MCAPCTRCARAVQTPPPPPCAVHSTCPKNDKICPYPACISSCRHLSCAVRAFYHRHRVPARVAGTLCVSCLLIASDANSGLQRCIPKFTQVNIPTSPCWASLTHTSFQFRVGFGCRAPQSSVVHVVSALFFRHNLFSPRFGISRGRTHLLAQLCAYQPYITLQLPHCRSHMCHPSTTPSTPCPMVKKNGIPPPPLQCVHRKS